MDTRDSRLSERDQAEIERSAEEARKIVLKRIDRAELDRYRNPPAILLLLSNMRFICWATSEARLCSTSAVGPGKT